MTLGKTTLMAPISDQVYKWVLRISLWWPIHIINSVDKTKLPNKLIAYHPIRGE